MKHSHYIKALLFTVLFAALLTSCGYSVRPEPAAKALSIGAIDNRTHEPGLAHTLRVELTDRLASRGVLVSDGSKEEITGTLRSLKVLPLAERGGLIVKFSVIIRGEFVLTNPDGTQRQLHTPLNYIVTFGSNVPLNALYSMRELAVKQAISELAEDIAAATAEDR